MRGGEAKRAGFTLLELLLVLGLLLLVAAWIAPEWRWQVAGRRLESAAKDLRSVLRETRLRAVEDGTAYVFEIVPGSGHYRVVPAAEREPGAEGLGQGGMAVEGQAEDRDGWRLESVLPDGLRLAEVESEPALAGRMSGGEEPTISADDGPPPEQAWVVWAVFYPQGTATDAEMFVEDAAHELRWRLSLRGLVARATIADVSQIQPRESIAP